MGGGVGLTVSARCSKAMRSRHVDGWISFVLLHSNKAESEHAT